MKFMPLQDCGGVEADVPGIPIRQRIEVRQVMGPIEHRGERRPATS